MQKNSVYFKFCLKADNDLDAYPVFSSMLQLQNCNHRRTGEKFLTSRAKIGRKILLHKNMLMIRSLMSRSRTDHNAYSEIPFSKNGSYQKETRQLICIANQLTGFFMAEVSTERHFRTYTTVLYKYISVKTVP